MIPGQPTGLLACLPHSPQGTFSSYMALPQAPGNAKFPAHLSRPGSRGQAIGGLGLMLERVDPGTFCSTHFSH